MMEKKKEMITAIIGAFSGHPNPVLPLDAETAEKLVDLFKTARGKEVSPPPSAPRLGYYYGFFVEIPQELAKRLDLPLGFTVYQGVITEGKGREQRHWRDIAHVEQFLLDQAQKQGHEELLKMVGIEKPK